MALFLLRVLSVDTGIPLFMKEKTLWLQNQAGDIKYIPNHFHLCNRRTRIYPNQIQVIRFCCCITNAFFKLQMITSLSKIEKWWISYRLDIYLAISHSLTLSIHNFNMHSDFLPLTLNFLSTNFTFCTRLANNSKCTTFQTQKDKRITCSKQHNIHVWPSVTMAT